MGRIATKRENKYWQNGLVKSLENFLRRFYELWCALFFSKKGKRVVGSVDGKSEETAFMSSHRRVFLSDEMIMPSRSRANGGCLGALYMLIGEKISISGYRISTRMSTFCYFVVRCVYDRWRCNIFILTTLMGTCNCCMFPHDQGVCARVTSVFPWQAVKKLLTAGLLWGCGRTMDRPYL